MAAQYNEGQRLQGSDGKIYVVQNGVPVEDAPASIPGGVVVKGADPTRPYQAPKAAADATIAGNKATASGLDPALAAEDLRGKRLANEKTAKELAQGNSGKGLTPEVRKDAIAGYTTAQQLRGLIQQMQDLDTAGPGVTKGFLGLKDYFPTAANQRLDNAGNSARGIIGSALGFTGGQLNTATEAAQAVGPYLPSAADRDEVRLDKINRLIDLANKAEQRSVAVLGGVPDQNGNISPIQSETGGLPASTLGPSGPGVPEIDRSGNREFVTDNDRAYADEVQRAFNNGADRAAMDAIALKYGATPFGEDLDTAIAKRRVGGRATFSTPVSGRDEAGFVGGALGGAAASPGGVAYNNFTNAMLPIGMFDPESADAFRVSSEQNPNAALAGSMIGGIPMVAGMELGAARMLPALAGSAPRIADATYGAYQGYGNAEEGQGVLGGIVGGVTSALGGEAGRYLMGGAGSVARGVTNQANRYLRDQGVRQTGGQIMGGTAKTIEDQLTGYPAIGGIIKNRRDEGLADYNHAMFRQGAENFPIHNIGERGAEELDRAVTQAYAPLNSVNMQADAPLMSGLAGAASRGQAIPGRADDFDFVVNSRVGQNFGPAGEMSGRNFQDAVRGLRQESNNQGMAAMHPAAFSDALGDVEGALTGMVQRQAPEAMNALEQGNRIYTNQSIIDQAVRAARNQRGPDGDALVMPSQLNTASVNNTRRYGGDSRSATTDRPFYDLATHGQEVLPSRVGDSGTAGRLVLGGIGLGATGAGAGLGASDGGGVSGAVSGGGTGLATFGGILAALAAGGTRPGQRAIASALMDRPEIMRQIGDLMINNRAIGGPVGAAGSLGTVNLLGGF